MLREHELLELEEIGFVPQPYAELLKDDWRKDPRVRSNPMFALDAQPQTITTPNVGIPAFLANVIDPQFVRVLNTPMKAAQAFGGEVKKGDWTTITTQFPVVEATGDVAPYGDYNNGGKSGSNYNWVPRQSYHYQTVSQFGDREVDMFGLAQINYVNDVNYGAMLVLNKFQNRSYLRGITGLQLYGALNDPSLPAAISPTTKLAGGTTWAVAQAFEIFNDVNLLYIQIQTQLQGYSIDRDTAMTLVLSPSLEPRLSAVTQFTLASVRQAIKENWPNMKIVTVPEMNTTAGQLMMMIVDEIDGVKTFYCAFTEKLRAGRIVPELSAYKQKKIGGTFGAICRRPLAVAQMIGM